MIGKFFLLIHIALGLQSCGLNGEPITETETETTDSSSDDSTYNSGGEAPSPNDPLDLMANNLSGEWIGPCNDDVRIIYVFSKSEWVQGTAIFSEGSDCAMEEIITTHEIGGYLTLEESIDSNRVYWRGDIVTFERTFYSQEFVDYLNSVAFHGYNDWQVSQRKQCIGRPESQGGSVLNEQSIYSVVEISATGALSVGQWLPASDQRSNDVTWEKGGPFTKRN